MKKIAVVLFVILLLLNISGCVKNSDSFVITNSKITQSIEPESSSGESSSKDENSSAKSDSSISENIIVVSMVNINKSIEAFDMKENDTAYGWTLTEIKPDETPPDAAFYGFLTFTGEVTLTGTITHVNAIYDGFEFVPDEESKGKILIPDGNPEKDFFVSIVNDTDPAIAESVSDLAIDESGEYTITLTQYRLAYVPMMATNNAIVSSIEKNSEAAI